MGQQQREFTQFYQSRRDDCLRAVLLSVGDGQLAEDLVADAFARAWGAWPRLREHPAPHAGVVRTALNLRVSWWRPRRREVALADHDLPGPAERPGVDATLVAALRRLPTRQREVVALRVFLDLDTESTAQVLGIASGTVKAHLSRAIAALRSQLVPVDSQEAQQ